MGGGDPKPFFSRSRYTTSSPLDGRLWHKVQHTKGSLKAHVRTGVAPSTRRRLWLEMLGVRDEDVVLYSRALGKESKSRDRHMTHYVT